MKGSVMLQQMMARFKQDLEISRVKTLSERIKPLLTVLGSNPQVIPLA